MIALLYKRLRARQWSSALMKEWMLNAATKLESESTPRKKVNADPKQRLFIHIKYQPKGISRQQIRAAFDKTCGNFSDT